MALIKVGVHENLELTPDTEVSEHGTLVLHIKAAQDANALVNAFETNTTFAEMKSGFIFWLPNMKDFQQNVKSATDLASDLLKRRHQLMQYALLFATKEEVVAAIGGTKMFEGSGEEDPNKSINMLTNEDHLKRVVKSLDSKFVAFLKSKNAFSGKVKFRQKFLRQSEANNYATIPNSDFDVWIEPMTIPRDASKVSFSEWEIKNGKDNPDPVASTKSEATKVDVAKASSLFKKTDDDTNKPDLT